MPSPDSSLFFVRLCKIKLPSFELKMCKIFTIFLIFFYYIFLQISQINEALLNYYSYRRRNYREINYQIKEKLWNLKISEIPPPYTRIHSHYCFRYTSRSKNTSFLICRGRTQEVCSHRLNRFIDTNCSP